MISRRTFLHAGGTLALAAASAPLAALTTGTTSPEELLDGDQSQRFRAWMTLVVAEQIKTGPTPRWQHRDCAGLARFAVAEALRLHDRRWQRAMGLEGRRLPVELELRPGQREQVSGWLDLDGRRQPFATALLMIQQSSRLLGREPAQARPGDLMFYDHGDDQHLMIWMGQWIAYHTGQAPEAARSARRPGSVAVRIDNGLRATSLAELLQWKDTRWRPRDDNPNFSGFFRLAFLSR